MTSARKILLITFWLSSAQANANQTEPQIEVTQQGERFLLSLQAHSQLPIDALWLRITDYQNIQNYHPAITYSKVVKPMKQGAFVKTKLQDCLLFFCRSYHRLEAVVQKGSYHIQSQTVPEKSDFKYGYQEWHLEPNDTGTTLKLKLEIEPKQSLVPWIGPMVVEYKMKQSTLEFLQNLERIDQSLINTATTP